MKIKDVTNFLEDFAPLMYQESYDNAGLIVGNAENTVSGILICIDSTEDIVNEAIEKSCNLIIAHHPIVFSGLKKITGKTYTERVLIKAIQHNIAIYAAHTNLDNIVNGVNAKIAEKLELKNCRILSPKSKLLKKLITFCPSSDVSKVRAALFAAGAGNIGNYSECSFNTEGTGTFKGNEDTTPQTGNKGKQNSEPEIKIETIFPANVQNSLLQALFKTHPYEEIAYDIIPLENTYNRIGAGIIGELEKEEGEKEFLQKIKLQMQTNCIRYSTLLGKKIKKVALCGGSGSFLLSDAISAGADILITADFKYHQFFDAEKNIVIADIGHYESEQFTKELFYEQLKKKFPTFALHLSNFNTNPINYL